MENLPLQACVVVGTSNRKISRRHLVEHVKKMHQKACGTCSTITFPHSTYQIIDLSCVVVVAVRLHSLNSLLTLLTVRALDRDSIVCKIIVLFPVQQMVRIGQSLEKYRDAKLQQFRNQLPSENSHVSFPYVTLLRDLLWSFKSTFKICEV